MKQGTTVTTPKGEGIYIGNGRVYLLDTGERTKVKKREVRVDVPLTALPTDVLDMVVKRYTDIAIGNGIEIRTKAIGIHEAAQMIKAAPETSIYCEGGICLYFRYVDGITMAVFIDKSIGGG